MQLTDADAHVASVIEQIQRRTLYLLRPYVLVSLVPATAVAIAEVSRGHATVWIVIEPLIVLAMALSFVLTKATPRLAASLTAGVIAFGTTALLHFGPMLSTGIVLALGVVTASYLFGRKQMVATITWFVALMGGAALASTHGWSPAWSPMGLTPTDWLRLVVGAAILLPAIGLFFEHVQRSMRDAVTNEVAAGIKQRAAEEERERALTAGITSQRLETLGQLAGGVAHDINNTLAVIQGTLDMLSRAPEAEREQLIGEGVTAVRNASHTVRRLLGLARRSSEEVGSCDPAVVLAAVVSAYRRVLPEALEVVLEVGNCPRVKISEPALEQVVVNLLVNARDATSGRGRVVIGCGEDGDRVRVTVSDDGPGMTEEVRTRAFEPFFSTKARGEGSGLGLSLVQRLVDNASGTVSLTSAVGQGARFEIRLPIDTAAPVIAPVPAVATDSRGGRVLAVEDDPQLVRILERVLARAKYDATVVSTVSAARDALDGPLFDLLLTDGLLPDGTANDVIAAFRVRHPDHPVIVCTGYLDDDRVLASLERQRGLEIVPKPFVTANLIARVSQLIEAPRA